MLELPEKLDVAILADENVHEVSIVPTEIIDALKDENRVFLENRLVILGDRLMQLLQNIILGLLCAVLILSIITVMTEFFIGKNTGAGRFFRAIRIRLREKSRTSFCVTAIVLLIFGLAAGDDRKLMLLAALGIMLVTLMVLPPEDFLSIFRTRRKAKKKTLLPLTPKLAGEVPAAKLAKVLEPIETEVIAEEGKE